MTDEELDALDAKLASQIGDDVAVIFDHEYLFKQSRIAIAALRTQLAEARAEGAALASWQCEFTDGKTGLVCDEYGNQFCAMKARADRAEAALAALEPAPRVNETPKSEHDRADVLTATTAAIRARGDA